MLRVIKSRSFDTKHFSTLNNTELKKFSQIKKEWWNESSKNGTGPLHFMNPKRVEFIRSQRANEIGMPSKIGVLQIRGQKVLDVGCGGGLLSESLARLGASVHSIDPSENNIIVAKEHSQYDNWTRSIRYQQATIEQIVESGEKYDIVCALEVIEHVNNPEKFLEQCCACVNDTGSLFISTMNKTMKAYLLAIMGAEAVLRLLPLGTHDWYKFMSPQEIGHILERPDIGMSVRSVKGLVPDLTPSKLFPPLSSWKLSDTDTDVNFILHASRMR